MARNDELREELQHIVEGLQTYLADVENRTHQQRSDVERMTQERDDMLRHLQEMEVDREAVEQQQQELVPSTETFHTATLPLRTSHC